MGWNRDVQVCLPPTRRGLQTLLVAHGVALLTLVTSYVRPDTPVPALVSFIVKANVVGLTYAILGMIFVSMAEADQDPSSQKARPRLLTWLICSYVCVFFSMSALGKILRQAYYLQ